MNKVSHLSMVVARAGDVERANALGYICGYLADEPENTFWEALEQCIPLLSGVASILPPLAEKSFLQIRGEAMAMGDEGLGMSALSARENAVPFRLTDEALDLEILRALHPEFRMTETQINVAVGEKSGGVQRITARCLQLHDRGLIFTVPVCADEVARRFWKLTASGRLAVTKGVL
jgi:hypothetical protein